MADMMERINGELADAILDTLSPQAVAIIAAHLQGASGRHPAHAEVAWFHEQLTEIVGGADALNDLFEEVGI